MNNINDTTFFDYLDGLLSPEDKQQFENYIANNPEAKSKLDKLIQDETAYQAKIESGNFEKISDKYSFEINKLQEVIDEKIKKVPKKNSLLDFVQNMFQPLWNIPMQAKGVVVALPVGAYLFAITFAPMQVAENQSTDDFFMQLTNLNDFQEFLPNSEYGDVKAVKLDNKSWNIEDKTQNDSKKRSGKALDSTCSKDLDSKIIEISSVNNPLSKQTLTYCGSIGQNDWKLKNIEIKKDKENSIKLNSNYELIYEKDSIFLIPETSE